MNSLFRRRIRQNAGRDAIAFVDRDSCRGDPRILANAATAGFAVLLCLVLTAPVPAGAIVQRHGKATLEVSFDADQPRIALSDNIVITLKIEGTAGLKVTAPRKFPTAAQWLLDDITQPTVETVGPGRLLWRQTYRCSPREPGALPFAFPEIQIRDGAADAETVAFDPIEFSVTTSITQPDRGSLRDRMDIEIEDRPPPVEESASPWWWAAAVAPALLIAVWLVRRYLGRKKSRSPLNRALYEWRRLQAMKLPERGLQERFVTLLTLLLRDYLERDLDLPARKQTTREFLQGASAHPSLRDTDRQFLADFLSGADAVKFAHVEISAAECHAWAEQLRHFLEERGQISAAQTGQASKNSPVEKSGQSG